MRVFKFIYLKILFIYGEIMVKDNWKNKNTFVCEFCMYFVEKDDKKGRCRKHAPTMMGYPVVYKTDFCGDHKLL